MASKAVNVTLTTGSHLLADHPTVYLSRRNLTGCQGQHRIAAGWGGDNNGKVAHVKPLVKILLLPSNSF
jgi:hypothetical protein